MKDQDKIRVIDSVVGLMASCVMVLSIYKIFIEKEPTYLFFFLIGLLGYYYSIKDYLPKNRCENENNKD